MEPIFLIKAPWSNKDFSFLLDLKDRLTVPIFVIGFCPYTRASLRAIGFKVINPFEFHHLGVLVGFYVFLDWPSFVSEKFKSMRMSLLGEGLPCLLLQSFSLKGEEEILEEFLMGLSATTIYEEKCDDVLLLRSASQIYSYYKGARFHFNQCHLLKDPGRWPEIRGLSVFSPFSIENNSEVLALSSRQRLIAMVSKRWTLKRSFKVWLFSSTQCQGLRGQPESDLVRCLRDDEVRGNCHQEDSLSRKTYYWNFDAEKWTKRFSSFLRRPGWWKEAQGFHFRAGLYDAGGAFSRKDEDRAA